MPAAQCFWNDLFPATEGRGRRIRVDVQVVKKHGRPFLLLPARRRMAAAALDLYPAQTRRARTARMVLRWLLRTGAPSGTERVSLNVNPDDSFVQFLSTLAGPGPEPVPGFGILAGNPASEGQRFLVVVFDRNQRPVAVVKAGLSEAARVLVRKETAFLEAASGIIAGIPNLRATFQTPRLQALALDFFGGNSPDARHERALPGLLRAWVDAKRSVPLFTTPDWLRLESAAAAHSLFPALAGSLRQRQVPVTIAHGDLAPWNIKVSPYGDWTVLDWERGEWSGIPGWDWFHYVVQPGILVERQTTPSLVRRVEALLDSREFREYAALTGIESFQRELVLAYLLYCSEVIKPAEGLQQTRTLLAAWASSESRL
jgi:hypothetical protein